jgi:hypothetical protein
MSTETRAADLHERLERSQDGRPAGHGFERAVAVHHFLGEEVGQCSGLAVGPGGHEGSDKRIDRLEWPSHPLAEALSRPR